MISLADLLGFQSEFAPTPSNAAVNIPIGPPWPGLQTSSLRAADGFPGRTEQPGRMSSGGAFAGDSGASWPALLPRLDALVTRSPPQHPADGIPFNLLDLAAAASAPPNLPLFPGALAPSWLRPLHEVQQAALSLNPSEQASSGDSAASPWTSGWSATSRIPAATFPYADRAASNPYVGSGVGAGELDPARTRRLLADAKRAYDFAAWISGGPSARPALPMGGAAAVTDAPRPGTPSAGSYEQFDRAVGLQPSQNQLGPASSGLFAQPLGWPFPRASMDAALPPMVVAASDQAPSDIGDQNGGATVPYPGPDSIFLPGSPSAVKAGRNFIRNVQDLIDTFGKWFSVSEVDKEACHKQYEYDEKQCYKNHSYNPDALSGCRERASEILIQCLKGQPEARPWTDVDTDGVEIPNRRTKRKR